MFLVIWKAIKGYAFIEITGFSVERFINLAINKGVYIWNIQHKRNSVIMNVSLPALELLDTCAAKTRCEIKIINEYGLPTLFRRYCKRKILLFGVILFCGIIYLLSSFIWEIEVNGNEKLVTSEILEFLKNEDTGIGSFTFRLKGKDIEASLLNRFKNISWVSTEIKGTKLIINMVETVDKPEEKDTTIPCNIIAAEDGVIYSIVVSAGHPLVKKKDVVLKDDLLVNGELVVKEDEESTLYKYVHAEGKIIAKTMDQFEIYESKAIIKKIYTHEHKKEYRLSVMGHTLPYLRVKPKFEKYDQLIYNKKLEIGKDIILPFELIMIQYNEYSTKTINRSEEEVKKILQYRVKRKIEEDYIKKDKEVIHQDITYMKENQGIKAKVDLVVLKSIGESQNINVEERRNDLIESTDGENNEPAN